jgi:hypothetical protein
MDPEEITAVTGQAEECLQVHKPPIVKGKQHVEANQTNKKSELDSGSDNLRGLVLPNSNCNDIDTAGGEPDCLVMRTNAYCHIYGAGVQNEDEYVGSLGHTVESIIDKDDIGRRSREHKISNKGPPPKAKTEKYINSSCAVELVHKNQIHCPGNSTCTDKILIKIEKPHGSAAGMDACDDIADVIVKKEVAESDEHVDRYRQTSGQVDANESSGIHANSLTVALTSDDLYNKDIVNLCSTTVQDSISPCTSSNTDVIVIKSERFVKTFGASTSDDTSSAGGYIDQIVPIMVEKHESNVQLSGTETKAKLKNKRRKGARDKSASPYLSMSIKDYEQHVYNLYKTNILLCQEEECHKKAPSDSVCGQETTMQDTHQKSVQSNAKETPVSTACSQTEALNLLVFTNNEKSIHGQEITEQDDTHQKSVESHTKETPVSTDCSQTEPIKLLVFTHNG